MNYEIVNLKEKTVAGISARTNNASSDMGAVIGGLWQRFYAEGIYQAVQKKVNDKALGIYTDYVMDEKADYTIMVAAETKSGEEQQDGLETRILPAGRYAKFIVKGDMHQAVAKFWQELWQMDLPRNYVADFEEYQNEDMEHAEIHMYIGLK